MGRLVFLTGVAMYALAVAFLLTDQLVWCPGVTERNCRRIRPGMTQQQVEVVFGGAAKGDYLYLRGYFVGGATTRHLRGIVDAEPVVGQLWPSTRGAAVVVFDSNGLAQKVEFLPEWRSAEVSGVFTGNFAPPPKEE